MKILGLTTEGDSGAALIEDGRVVAAENEERSSRLKLVEGFPRAALRQVLELSGTRVEDLDAVVVGGTSELFVDELRPFNGWFAHWDTSRTLGGRVKRLAGRFSKLRSSLPFLEQAYYALLAPSYARRRHGVCRILRREFGVRCPIEFVDHHFAHATSAYYTSGFEDALVVTLDGGGDGKSGSVYAVRDGRFERLHEVSAFNSLGNYYAYVTHIAGFTAMKHEGKITGLAAYGEPVYLDLLRECIEEKDGTLHNLGGRVFLDAIRDLESRLPEGWTREDLAASIQCHCEELTRRFVGHWVERTGMRNLALAGGIFANVRINQEMHELPGVENVFVHPGMGDGGLGVGAGLAAAVHGIIDRPMRASREPLPDVYLGSDLDEASIRRALDERGLEPEELDAPIEEEIASLLAQGYVVARASGRMEYGPRALGNRSILYQPTDASVNDWLNRNLRRTEFMPFAPAVLYEAREECFENTGGAEHAAEFMTITFRCTPWACEALPGVVHLDGTARPQLVRRETNPGYYAIIEAFADRTGLPAIINTSFNMHEEPIVRSAEDCVRAFLDGRLDYLALGPWLIKHPRGITHPLKPVQVAARAQARQRTPVR